VKGEEATFAYEKIEALVGDTGRLSEGQIKNSNGWFTNRNYQL
jgi:hypothetical protein